LDNRSCGNIDHIIQECLNCSAWVTVHMFLWQNHRFTGNYNSNYGSAAPIAC
jgi:hypothetical protein